MQIPNINRYLLNIYVVLKVFKHFNSPGVWSLGLGVLILVDP